MYKICLPTLMLLFLSLGAFAKVDVAPVQWVVHLGGVDRDSARCASVLPDGSVLATGYFENDFWPEGQNPPSGVAKPFVIRLRDLYWAKFDPNGNVLWVKGAGSRHCDVAAALGALPDGSSAVLAAYGYDGAACQFGYGEPNQTRLLPYDKYDVALARINADGTIRWARRCGGTGYDDPISLALVPDGGCYFTCTYTTDFRMGDEDGVDNNEVQLDSESGNCVVYYDSNGVFRWYKLGDSYDDVKPLPDNSCLAMCWHEGVRCLAPDGSQPWELTESDMFAVALYAAADSPDFYVAWVRASATVLKKYRLVSGGPPTLVWSKNLLDHAAYVLLAASTDGFCCAISNGDNRVLGIDKDGNTRYDTVFAAPWYSVSVAPDHGIVLAGCLYQDTIIGEGQPGAVSLTHRGSGDIFLAKFRFDTLYTVTTHTVGKGAVNLSPPGGAYYDGTQVTATAWPTYAWHDRFDHWEGDITGSNPTVSFTVDAKDYSCTAYFQELPDAPDVPVATIPALLAGIGGILLMGTRWLMAPNGPARKKDA